MTHLQQIGYTNYPISDIDKKRNHAALLKIKTENLSLEEIQKLVTETLVDNYEFRMVGTLTNSPIGSSHWFSTILSYIKDIGEFMQNHELTDDQRKTWGEVLVKYSQHLLDNYTKIPFYY